MSAKIQTTSSLRAALWLRAALGLALSALAVVGCDQDDWDRSGGIESVTEVADAPASTGAASDFAPTARPEYCAAYDEEDDGVVSTDLAVCLEISVMCLPDWVSIPTECGCGCEYVGDPD